VTFHVLTAAQIVEPYADAVRIHADTEKVALGFTPASAYREAALSGKLFVAIAEAAGQRTDYAGHLLFGGTFPYIRIFQVYVVPKYRRRKVGALLLQTLIKRSGDLGYLSISARVAGDLGTANAFWRSEGFQVLRIKAGGRRRARTIGVLTKELDTPRLFAGPQQVTSPSTSPMRMAVVGPGPSSCVIDLNVLLDLVKARPQADDVRRLLAASWTRIVDVFVTEELVGELRRAGVNGPDPVLEFASSLPRLPRVPRIVLEECIKQLAPIVFPEKAARNSLSKHDDSDLVYLATSIHHGVNGFITGEKAILKRAPDLRRVFGVDVIGTTEFASFIVPAEHIPETELRSGVSDDELATSEMSESDRHGAQDFLRVIGVRAQISTAALSPGVSGTLRRRIQVRVVPSGEYVGFASWDAPIRLNDRINVYVFVDEDHSDATAIAAHLYAEIMRDVAARGPTLLMLRTPEGHLCARTAGVGVGFGAVASETDDHTLYKVSIGGAVTEANWSAVGARLRELGGFSLDGIARPPGVERQRYAFGTQRVKPASSA
jgi:GNAT superfamily N-acetyltransferase